MDTPLSESTTRPAVLIVDDDEVDREQLRRALRKDYEVHQAPSLAEASKLLETIRIDAALVDYRLPDGDGLELASTLEQKGIPMVLVTGVGTERVAVDAFKQGCLEYLSKDGLTADSIRVAVLHVIEKSIFSKLLKEKQLEVKQHVRALEAANEELSVFASIVAHDVKEPLRSMSAAAERLDKLKSVDSETASTLSFLHQEASRATLFIDRLLDYANIDRRPVDYQEVDLGEIIAAVNESLHKASESSGTKISHAELPSVIGDPLLLHQLFQNLITNSIKHRQDKEICIKISATESDADHCEILVQDNGPGMTENQVAALSHGESRRGLGLEICKKVVFRHKGTFNIDSTPNIGTTVRITLPLHQELTSS